MSTPTPKPPATQPAELPADALDKVVGGMRKAGGDPPDYLPLPPPPPPPPAK